VRAITFGGSAIGTVVLGLVLVTAAQTSMALPALLVAGLVVPAALIFKPRIITAILFCFAAALPVEVTKALAVDSTGTIVLAVSPADLIFLLLLPFWISDRYLQERDIGWTGGHSALAALIVWMVVSTLMSRSLDSSAVFVLIYLKYFLFFLVLADLGREPAFLRALLWGAAAGISLQIALVGVEIAIGRRLAIAGAKHALVGRNLVFSEADGLRAMRPSGLMNHPNSLAALMAAFLPVALSLFMFARRQLSRLTTAALLLLGLLGGMTLLLTLSRGAWLAVAAGVAFLLAAALYKGILKLRHGLALLAAAAAIAAIIAALYPPVYLRLFGGDQGASTARVLFNDQAAMMVEQNPITGVGPGAYVKAARTTIPPSFSRVPPEFRAELLKGFVHNKYLLIAAETGLVGLMLFVVMLWRWIRSPLGAVGSEGDIRDALTLGLCGGMVAQCVVFVFEHAAYDVRVALLFVSAALATAVAGRTEPIADGG
jgi:O-antigen ligase